MGPKKRCQWQEESMELALESVSEGMNVTEAARIFQIPRQTLKDQVSQRYDRQGGGRPSELTPEEEKILVDYVTFMAKCSHPLSVAQIKAYAWAIVTKSGRPSRFNPETGPSWRWWGLFKKRHHQAITLLKPDNLDRGRSRMCNQHVMNGYFKILKELLVTNNVLDKPAHLFNADESAINLTAQTGKVIVPAKYKHAYSEQKGPRDHITTMVCCSLHLAKFSHRWLFLRNAGHQVPMPNMDQKVVYMGNRQMVIWTNICFCSGSKKYSSHQQLI